MHSGRSRAAEAAGHPSRQLHRRLVDNSGHRKGRSLSHQRRVKSSDRSGFQNKPTKERNDTNTDDTFHRYRSKFSVVQSSSVTRQSELLSVMPGTFSSGTVGSTETVSTTPGSHGLSDIANSTRQATHEGFPTMGDVTGDTPEMSVPASYRDNRVCENTTSLEKPGIPFGRSNYGDDSVQENNYYRCLPFRLGSDTPGQSSKRDMELQPTILPYQLFGAHGSVSSTETLLPAHTRPSRASQDRQHDDSMLYQQTGWSQVSVATHTSAQTDYLGRSSSTIAQSRSCPGSTERRSGSAIQGELLLRGMVPTPRSGDSTLGAFWSAASRPICVSREREMSAVFLSTGNGSPRSRCTGARVAQSSTICFPSAIPDSPHTQESEGPEADSNTDRPKMGTLDVGDHTSPVRPAMGTPVAQGSPVTSGRRNISSSARAPSTLGLARERINLSTVGLSPRVIATIQCARAQSTRTVYDGKWRVFEEWCEKSHVVPFQAPVTNILSFLQDLIDKGRAFSTVKVYLAAISACHIGFEGTSVGQHPIVARFMKGARRQLPVSKSIIPPWDLALVLDSLTQPPFEPLDIVDLKFLTLKTALLLALTTTKRVSDIHALSVHPECTYFTDNNDRVVIKPNPSFVPKNPLTTCVPVELQAFHPPPFNSQEDQRLHYLCPVRALRSYVTRTKDLRKSEQLFVSWAKQCRGQPVTKQRLSHWLVEAIQLAYSSMGQQPPEGLRAHSTRGMSASWALFKGISLQDICAAASWSSPMTFARFYSLDVTAQPLAHAVLSVSSRQGLLAPQAD